jgi:hypothetical protein
VFPVFPALCICFGAGVCRAVERYGSHTQSWIERQRVPDVDISTIATAFSMLLLMLLVINGGVQAAILAEKVSEGRQQPVEALDTMVEDGESVGVIRNRAYHDTLTYTGGDIRPTILYEGNASDLGKFTTRLATYQQVNSSDFNSFNVTYLYFRVEYEYINRLVYRINIDRPFIDRVTKEGEIVYEKDLITGSFRTTNSTIYVVRLNRNNEDTVTTGLRFSAGAVLNRVLRRGWSL